MDITPLDIIPADGAEQDNVKEPKDEGSINDSVDNEVGVTAEAEVNREENKQQWQSTQGESIWRHREVIKRILWTNQGISYEECPDDLDKLDQPKQCKLGVNCIFDQPMYLQGQRTTNRRGTRVPPNTTRAENFRMKYPDIPSDN